jgi:hypothetical protein
LCLVGKKRADIARVIPCENNFCTKYAHHLHFCGLQKLNTLNLRLFHPPLNPRNHFSTVLIETNWYTMICKYYGCYELTSITIPNSVTSIGKEAFYACRGLTSVTIGNSVTSIGQKAFIDCSGLTSVNISDIAAWFNITFADKFSNPLNCAEHFFLNGVEIEDLVIPNGVTSIGGWAFIGCKSMTSVTIGNSVTSIENCAFFGCRGLISVTIGNSVTSIGKEAFLDCRGLTSITIGNSVTSIGNYAFGDCI